MAAGDIDHYSGPAMPGRNHWSTCEMPAPIVPSPRRPDLIVAIGDRRYRVERPFGAWSENPGKVTDVTVASDDRMIVLLRADPLVDPAAPTLIELDAEGGCRAETATGLIADGHMLAATPSGRLLVVDRDMHEVVICDLAGARISGLGRRAGPLEPFNHPTDAAEAADGEIYVTDGYAASRVHRFSHEGELIGGWGEVGDGPGQFLDPHAVAITPDNRVLIADRGNHRIQVFSRDGRVLDIWKGFYKPMSIAIDPGGNILVTDQVPSLHLLAPDGQRIGRCRPVLNGAHGVAADSRGAIYLAEINPSRVTRLMPL